MCTNNNRFGDRVSLTNLIAVYYVIDISWFLLSIYLLTYYNEAFLPTVFLSGRSILQHYF